MTSCFPPSRKGFFSTTCTATFGLNSGAPWTRRCGSGSWAKARGAQNSRASGSSFTPSVRSKSKRVTKIQENQINQSRRTSGGAGLSTGSGEVLVDAGQIGIGKQVISQLDQQ